MILRSLASRASRARAWPPRIRLASPHLLLRHELRQGVLLLLRPRCSRLLRHQEIQLRQEFLFAPLRLRCSRLLRQEVLLPPLSPRA